MFLQSWVRYHARHPQYVRVALCLQITILEKVKYLGFDHFTVYDIDGSAASYLAPLLNSTSLTYYNSWAPIACLATFTAYVWTSGLHGPCKVKLVAANSIV